MDDCHNSWGTTLCVPEVSRAKRPAAVMEAKPDDSDRTNFRLAVSKTLQGKLRLQKITPNGSDANLFAINATTSGNNEGILVACGSYVSGDGGPLQAWSTLSFTMENGPSYIKVPSEIDSVFTTTHTVALPYHIPSAIKDADALELYEDECLHDLHVRCLVAKMKQKPITALLLELTLANNGTTLSDRFLGKLGELACHHGFRFIVDEVMTGAREGAMLACLAKPPEFFDEIAYVTMGKWMTRGLVFSSVPEHERLKALSASMPSRGQSTSVECRAAMDLWKTAEKLLPNTANRRAALLKKLGITEVHAWGKGLHIFAPVCRPSNCTGSKIRYLPMLSNTPFDSFRFDKRNCKWNKHNVNEDIIEQCKEWLKQPYLLTTEDRDFYKLASTFASSAPEEFLSTQYVLDQMDKGHNIKSVSLLLRAAEEAGLAAKVSKTIKRLRGWEIQEYANPPWGL